LTEVVAVSTPESSWRRISPERSSGRAQKSYLE
jgi:hypothetical protein